MKTKTGLEVRDLCGEKVIVAEEAMNVDFCHVIHLNESAAFLWEKLSGREFTESDMADLLCREYAVGKTEAVADCRRLVARWREAGIVEP